MRTFTLPMKKVPLFLKGESFFYERDLEDSIKSCTPGEWVFFDIVGTKTLGFINPHAQKSGQVVILKTHHEDPRVYIKESLENAVNYRKYLGYETNARIVYGDDDGLPGLIVDSYENIAVIQINKAGIDIYRDYIKETLESLLGKKAYFLDNEKYREDEGLPAISSNDLPQTVSILENDIRYELPKEKLQKIGYYYDHRENRQSLNRILQRINKSPTRGLDLFCYIGSWGLNAQKSGVKNMTYVDQAPMEDVVLNNVRINGNELDGTKFVRSDVFKFLEDDNSEYDLIICDPPAFTKSEKNKQKALGGYEKLYNKIFPKLMKDSVLVAASCTKYISLEEMDVAVQKAATKNHRNIRILDLGKQGWDHPIRSMKSKSNYIKYISYYVE